MHRRQHGQTLFPPYLTIGETFTTNNWINKLKKTAANWIAWKVEGINFRYNVAGEFSYFWTLISKKTLKVVHKNCKQSNYLECKNKMRKVMNLLKIDDFLLNWHWVKLLKIILSKSRWMTQPCTYLSLLNIKSQLVELSSQLIWS